MSFWDIFNLRRFRCSRRSAPVQTPVVTESPSPELQAYAASVRADYEAVLKRMVEIPSVSVEPERKGDIERTAQAAVELLRSIGLTAEAIKTAGNPVVYGEIITDPANETVLIYNHL